MMNEIVEACPNCDRIVNILWDTEDDGYQIFCPYCGEKIMLCDECYHSEDNPEQRCDWSENGCFRSNKKVMSEVTTDLSSCNEKTKAEILNNAKRLKERYCTPCKPTLPECEDCLKQGKGKSQLAHSATA